MTATATVAQVATVNVTTTPTQVIATTTATVTTTYTPAPVNSFTDGVQLIGTDIPAGTYKTSGVGDSSSCYYAILNSTDTTDIASNDIVKGPTRAVLPRGKYFDTSGGCTWARVG